MCDRQQALQAIATTVADYRTGEVIPITTETVDAWVRQFEQFGFTAEYQFTILTELNRILKRFYIKQEFAQRLLQSLIKNTQIFGEDLIAGITGTKFLRIQQKGNSQNELVDLLDETLQQEYGITSEECGEDPSRYIYLDDCIYTGNHAAHDLENWLPQAKERVPLDTLTFALHTIGIQRLYKTRNRFRQEKGIIIEHKAPKTYQLKNNPSRDGNYSECYWPQEVAGFNECTEYIAELRQRCEGKAYGPRLFRPNGNPYREEIFSSAGARDVIEYAFLRARLHIMSLPQNVNPTMRPMGYEYLESLGFGALPVIYRNISNNAPLALWWGDPNGGYPLNQWQPLFSRQANDPGLCILLEEETIL